jgi:hypothetical protein
VLQSLIGAALTDNNFRLALLNGSRQRLLSSFPLTGEEIETIMAIRADSLEQLAGEIHRRLIGDGNEPEPLPPLRRGKLSPIRDEGWDGYPEPTRVVRLVADRVHERSGALSPRVMEGVP